MPKIKLVFTVLYFKQTIAFLNLVKNNNSGTRMSFSLLKMKKEFTYLFICLFCVSCKNINELPPDLRADLVNSTFQGTLNIGNDYYTESSFRFMRGGIRDPYYLVSVNYFGNSGSGLIEILEDDTFLISLSLDEEEFEGRGYLKGRIVSIYASSINEKELFFQGQKVQD